MKKMITIACCLIITICLLSFNGLYRPVFADNKNNVELTSAQSMCLMETASKRVLFEKNKDKVRANASTTKIVTALTVLNIEKNLDRQITVNHKSIGIEGTSLYLKQNEKKTIRELLYALMLISGNDCAQALAYEYGGNVAGFCEMMNQTAKKCGAQNSNFVNPHGLDEVNHYTTAHDLALITANALNNNNFKQICSTKNYKISGHEKGQYKNLTNKNKLLHRLPGCIGVKTGYTRDAGRCLVSACERDGMQLVCVLLNCGPMFEESANLLEKAYQKYKIYSVMPEYSVVKNIKVEGGSKDSIKLYTKKQFKYPLTTEEYIKLEYIYTMPTTINAPISKEKIVGSVKIKLNNDLLFEENIYTMEEVRKYKSSSSIFEVIKRWFK